MRGIRRAEKECEYCGEIFAKDPRNTWAYWEKARFCCQACAGLAWKAQAERNRAPMREVFSKWFERSGRCWTWNGARDKDGYGVFTYAGKTYRAHVIALELDGRPVPSGQYGCHDCDNPACVRPDHLYPGTPKRNMSDAVTRGRTAHGERCHFAKLTAEAVRHIRSSDLTDQYLADLYQVSRPAVSMARSGKTWRHL